MKAIDTFYRGYRFRSRLEARWAVFFDTLNIKYEYELEGFELDNGLWYLPDFYLPSDDMYAEVKPNDFSVEELDKCALLDKTCLLLVGSPDFTAYRMMEGLFNPKTQADYDTPFKDKYIANWCIFRPGVGQDYHDIWWDQCAYDPNDDPANVYEGMNFGCEDEITDGVLAARSARFEFGENGQ